jgi:hypothetical protein
MGERTSNGGQEFGSLFFPGPPDGGVLEWAGTPIGLSNTITQTKRRAALQDKNIDRHPERLEELTGKAVRRLERERARGGNFFQHDVVIHGVRVRALTNLAHLYDFWVDNWYSPEEWHQITGRPAPPDPWVTAYAVGGIESEDVVAYYSRRANTILFFNSTYYGQLKSWVLGAVGRILAEQYGIHSIHGASVEYGGKGVLYIAPTGTGKSTSSYGLTQLPETRFHSDDWVYVRYTLPMRGGEPVSPFQLELEREGRISGSELYSRLPQAPGKAQVKALTLEGDTVDCRAEDLEREAPLEAYAYISEKTFYLRTNLVESFPQAAPQLIRSKCENIPDVRQSFMSLNQVAIDAIVRALEKRQGGESASGGPSPGQGELARQAGRLFAFHNSRAMLDMTHILPRERVYTNPLEPLPLKTVFLLKRDAQDSVILRSLNLAALITALARGITPAGTREIAYNDYRLVDNRRERHVVAFIEWQLAGDNPSGAIDPEAFYQHFWGHQPMPPTLKEEMALFHLLYQAAQCYGVNTILQEDVRVSNVQEAVRYTLDIMARAIVEEPKELHLTLDNYRQYVVSRRT